MPVHFNSYVPNSKSEEMAKSIRDNVGKEFIEKAEEAFRSEDKKKLHMTSYFKDLKTGKKIGKVVVTLMVREEHSDVVDIDVTLLSKNKVKLHFERKLIDSSEANEYYEVYSPKDERHFDVETVSRYMLNAEEIVGTDQEVYISFFPFEVKIFDNEKEMNKHYGFDGQEVDLPGVGKKPLGLDTYMMSVGSLANGMKEPSSFINGTINGYRDVQTEIAGVVFDFTIIDLKTAIGNVPVAVNKENFDLSKIGKGKIVSMLTDVKADFGKQPGIFNFKW